MLSKDNQNLLNDLHKNVTGEIESQVLKESKRSFAAWFIAGTRTFFNTLFSTGSFSKAVSHANTISQHVWREGLNTTEASQYATKEGFNLITKDFVEQQQNLILKESQNKPPRKGMSIRTDAEKGSAEIAGSSTSTEPEKVNEKETQKQKNKTKKGPLITPLAAHHASTEQQQAAIEKAPVTQSKKIEPTPKQKL